MARLMSCHTVAILVCIFAATAMSKELIGKEKRSELSEGLLAAFGGIPKSGPVMRARSLKKETRSVSDGGAVSSSNGYNPNCVISSSNHANGGNGQNGGYSWDFDSSSDWRGEMDMSSGAVTGYSSWTMVCAQFLSLMQFIFVLVSMA